MAYLKKKFIWLIVGYCNIRCTSNTDSALMQGTSCTSPLRYTPTMSILIVAQSCTKSVITNMEQREYSTYLLANASE
jgi:hypothetical protein